MAALTRAPVSARAGPPAPGSRKSAVAASRPQLTRLLGVRSVALPGRRSLRAVVAAAGDDGYSSSDDAEVVSGKRKAVSSMSVAELKAELTAAGLDATGTKPELSARVKAARTGKPLPAAAEFAAMSSSGAAKSGEADESKTIARLEEELALSRQMAAATVNRAEKAETALAAMGSDAPAAGGGGSSTSPALLRIQVKLCFGDNVLCCGSHAGLGAWDVAGAASLAWSEGDVWQAQVALPQEGRLELKFLVRTAEGGLVWQAGSNTAVEVQKGTPGDAVPPQRQLAFTGNLSFHNGDRRQPATFTVNGPTAPPAPAPEAPPAPKKKKAEKAEAPAPAPEAAPPAPEQAPPAPEPAAPAPEAAAPEAPAAEAPAPEPAAESA